MNSEIYRKINNIGKVISAKELNELVDKTIFRTVGKARATKCVLNDYVYEPKFQVTENR
jgi:hypothetical protein